MKLGILKEFTGLEQPYVDACRELGIEYEVIDIIASDWMQRIKDSDCDGYLVRSSYAKDTWKRMYDEKVYYINVVMGKPVYPPFNDIFIHESKNNMAYWLEAHDIPQAGSWVFYRSDEAAEFIETKAKFPLIFKPTVGSYALGVKIINNQREAKKLIKQVFTKYGFFNRGFTKYKRSKIGLPVPVMDDRQFNHLMFQERIDIKYEWRMVKVDQSYFGHQKLKKGDFHSGSGMVGWVDPPEVLLELIRYICDIGNFNALNVDVFEDQQGNYFVNELQPFWGAVDTSQMYVDGKPGRYFFRNGGWFFEEGVFCQNACCNLKVQAFINQLEEAHLLTIPLETLDVVS
ncbi:MAG: hypothetical protein NUK65_05235 [Firmicutes bacterium]|nr:hypothetical protein [Bacillota bacterium]